MSEDTKSYSDEICRQMGFVQKAGFVHQTLNRAPLLQDESCRIPSCEYLEVGYLDL